jgi:hypothetical protein
LLAFHRREPAEYTDLECLISEKARASKFRLREEVERMGKTMAQVVEERAAARGRQEGRAEGRLEGERERLRWALARLLESRFGELDAATTAALAAADLDTLDAWFRRALTAATLAEIGGLEPASRVAEPPVAPGEEPSPS